MNQKLTKLVAFQLILAIVFATLLVFSVQRVKADRSKGVTSRPRLTQTPQAVTAVDLSTYLRKGRFDLPEPTRTAHPPNSLLAQEASSVTYDWDTDTLFVVGDGGTSVVQVTKTGTLIDSMTLPPGNSPQGTTFFDTEGLSYVGNGKFVFTEERDRQAVLFTYVAGGILQRSDAKTVKLGTTIGNIGLEGVTFDPQTGGYIFVKEKDPQSIFQTQIDFDAGTATNGGPTQTSSTDLFNPALANLADFSDVFALSNLPSLTGQPDSSHLLIISQESGQIINIDRSGNVFSRLTIVADAGNPLSVADQTHEGVTMDRDGNLYTVSENGGGDANHPQLWVYAPSTAQNLPPTAVTLNNKVASIPENTSTAAPLKLADIVVTDDGLGTNNLTVTGADAGFFQIIGTGLFLRAGTALNAAAKPTYNVTVVVDDPAVGNTPDATTTYSLSITASTGGNASLIITEVAPWSSGNGGPASGPTSLRADWFEVTNVGNAVANITGWKMDDDSKSFGSAVALNGIANIAPGESVIFIETADLAGKAAAFKALWFGANPPASLQIGSYTGSGVGLSTGGDQVNLFDSGGTLQASVVFGASPSGPFPSFDNAAGLNNATISTLSAVGINGAFAAAGDAAEIGSPGNIGAPPTPIVTIVATDPKAAETGSASLVITEVAPWSSGNGGPASGPTSLRVDWFEVTNIGTAGANIMGWKMDDDSKTIGNAVALNGISNIAPGESVIFMETTDLPGKAAAFKALWFGSSPPANLQFGSYNGSGVGLSTGGDQVNLFDAAGTLQASVSFGPSPAGPFPTFDNAARLNNATISTLAAVGTNGAFAAAGDATEIGSPGTIGGPAASSVDTGTFRIFRTGSTVGPLTVSYNVATGPGQATNGVDYKPLLPGTVTIPSGQSFVDITITPVNDPIAEGPETVTLTLTDSGSYDAGTPSTATVTIADNPFLGVAAGDASSSTAVLWTRINPAQAVPVTAQLSTDSNFSAVLFSFSGTSDLTKDNTVKIAATGLTPGTRYFYRFVVDATGEVSGTGIVKTAPAANTAAPLHFAISGDNDGLMRPYALANIFPSQNLDFYINLGDVIYETASNLTTSGPHNGQPWLNSPNVTLTNDSLTFDGIPRVGTTFATQAQLKGDFEKKYRENFLPVNIDGQNALQILYASQGNYTTWDNHELGNRKYIDGGAPAGGSVGGASGTDMPTGRGVDARAFTGSNTGGSGNINNVNDAADLLSAGDLANIGGLMNKATGFQALENVFVEYQPIADRGTVNAPNDPRTNGTKQLYSANQWGKNAIYINTDGRSYRDIRLKTANAAADDNGPRADNPSRTFLGATQLAWLKQALLDAQNNGTTWKFVTVSDPIDQLGPIGGALTGTLTSVNTDAGKSLMGGYRAERNNLLKFIADNRIVNVVFMATDDHQNRINELLYSPSGQTGVPSSYVKVPFVFSIVCGPLGATGPETITDHSFTNIKAIADNLAAAQVAAGVNPIGLENYPGLHNLVRESDPTAGTNPQPVDFYSPDTFNFNVLDISANGKTLTVSSIGMNATAQNAGIEFANGPQARTIFSFQIDGVNTNTATALASSVNPSVFGQPVTFTATVTATGTTANNSGSIVRGRTRTIQSVPKVNRAVPDAGTPTGTVTFFDGATQIGTGTLDGSGVATLTTATLSVGQHSITANYGGDTTFAPGTSPIVVQTVNKANTTTANVTSSANPGVFGQTITFSTTVAATAPGAGIPTGTVMFFDGITQIGTGNLNGSGVASLAISSLAVGTHSITAVYPGNANFNGSATVAALAQIINKANTITTIVTPNPAAVRTTVTFTATVTAAAPGAGVPTGTVQFRDNGVNVGVPVVLVNGVASVTESNLTLGNHVITAIYSGDGNFNTSTGTITGGLNVGFRFADTASGNTLIIVPPANGQPGNGTYTWISNGVTIVNNAPVAIEFTSLVLRIRSNSPSLNVLFDKSTSPQGQAILFANGKPFEINITQFDLF